MRARLLVISLAACSGGSGALAVDAAATVDAMPRETVIDVKMLQAGELGEATLTGGASDRAVVHLLAPNMLLDFDIHGHSGGGTQTLHEEFGIMSADYSFIPPSSADWFLLIRNDDAVKMSVDVKIELYGAMTWSGWL